MAETAGGECDKLSQFGSLPALARLSQLATETAAKLLICG
jgi:hypothetical protein